jgi:hypothetical protein
MSDGSLFLPYSLANGTRPFDQISASRLGSYWNLVVPYAFASGFFRPGSPDARGLVEYMLAHGSRMLGVPRADAHIVYPNAAEGRTFGLGQIYGLSSSRFLADNDDPDQLVLSLYGMMAAGMTPDTFVSGEAVSVLPLGRAYYRKMYMPPNSGANGAFLETLRLMLVHERRGPRESRRESTSPSRRRGRGSPTESGSAWPERRRAWDACRSRSRGKGRRSSRT